MKAMIYDWNTDIYPTDSEVKELCRPGAGADTCSWLMAGSKGFECCSLNRPPSIIDRRKIGDMVAMRDGCDKVDNFNPTTHGLGEVEF